MASVSLVDVIGRALRVPASSITDASSPETLRRWDSLRHLELMTAIEDAYGIELSTADMMHATSVGAIRKLLREKGLVVE